MMQAPMERSEYEAPTINYPAAPQEQQEMLPENVMYYAPVKYEPLQQIQRQQPQVIMNMDYPAQEQIEELIQEQKPLKETWQMDSFQYLSLDRQKRKQYLQSG